MSVIVSFRTNTFLFVFQRVFSWFCAADEPVVSLKCGEDGSLETGSLEGLRARAFLPPCSGKTWIKRCPKIEDHANYSFRKDSIVVSLLLSLGQYYHYSSRTHSVVLEVFLWNFSLRERESEPRSRENESRRGVERGKGFFLSIRHSRLALFKAKKIWRKTSGTRVKTASARAFSYVSLLFYKMYR